MVRRFPTLDGLTRHLTPNWVGVRDRHATHEIAGQQSGPIMAELHINPDEIRPLVREIVEAVVEDAEHHRHLLNGKLAMTESEAAALLGLNPWQLRDLRLSGQISYSRIVGKRVRYTLDDLLGYLRSNRQMGKRQGA